ncbi:hypothetical protein [Haloparvum sp. AD34]
MILTVAAFLTILGFIGWISGELLGYPEIAIIAAVIVLGVGSMVAIDGLQYRDGKVETNTSADETTIEYQYQSVETIPSLELGALWMLLGGVMALRSLSTAGDR